MRTPPLRALVVALALISVGSCGSNTGDGKQVRVFGENLVLELASNATTGYMWQPAAEFDDAVVRLVEEH